MVFHKDEEGTGSYHSSGLYTYTSFVWVYEQYRVERISFCEIFLFAVCCLKEGKEGEEEEEEEDAKTPR